MVNKLKQITGKNKETNCYIGHGKCETKLTEAKSLVHKIQGKPSEALHFKSDNSVIPFLRNLHTLGGTKMAESKQYNVKIKEDKENCHKDENTCYIVGICELPSGDLVIADHNNKRVKLLDSRYKVIDHLDLPAPPRHLCHTSGSEVAVAVDDGKIHEIYILTVTKRQLQVLRQFTTDHDCYSICHNQGQLYVGSTTALYQYTIDGLKFLISDGLNNKLYEDKSSDRTAVSHDGERIYITNHIADKLMILDKRGQVLSTLELRSPRGLCVSPSGHVFVCGARSNTVLQVVDREGRQELATVAWRADGVECPQSVWFREQTSRLIVGNYNKDIIVVIKLNVEM